MPVYEIRNPSPPPPIPRETPAAGTPLVEGVPPIVRVRHLRREWIRRQYGAPLPAALVEAEENSGVTIQRVINTVNEDFTNHNVPIHFSLVREGDTYLLDIYDCSGSEACRLVADLELPLAKIPDLLLHLQQELGIIIDQHV